jgi:predicted Fe-Mo cluster-binding NifX family protein
MKLCFPVKTDKGLDSLVFNHFGSSPLFVVIDTEKNETSVINNQDLGHSHGMCNPFKALNGEIVDSIIVGGIGSGAIRKLNSMGIKVYRAGEDTIRKNIGLFASRLLTELSVNDACSHHGGCDH